MGNMRLSIQQYCEKYKVTRGTLMRALHNCHIHATRYPTCWWIQDEPIDKELTLSANIYYNSTGGFFPETSLLEEIGGYDEALQRCRNNRWLFETFSHGDYWSGAMSIEIE